MHLPRFTFAFRVDGRASLLRGAKALALSLCAASALLLPGCGDGSEQEADGQSASGQSAVFKKSDDGTIKADPNPVPAGTGSGTSKISWSTKPDIGPVEVRVSENGEPEVLFGQGAAAAVDAPWIQANATYEFRLYAGQGPQRRLLDRVQVTRAQ